MTVYEYNDPPSSGLMVSDFQVVKSGGRHLGE